jgi:hypothetical protein
MRDTLSALRQPASGNLTSRKSCVGNHVGHLTKKESDENGPRDFANFDLPQENTLNAAKFGKTQSPWGRSESLSEVSHDGKIR